LKLKQEGLEVDTEAQALRRVVKMLTIDEKSDPFRITHHHNAFRKTILADYPIASRLSSRDAERLPWGELQGIKADRNSRFKSYIG